VISFNNEEEENVLLKRSYIVISRSRWSWQRLVGRQLQMICCQVVFFAITYDNYMNVMVTIFMTTDSLF